MLEERKICVQPKKTFPFWEKKKKTYCAELKDNPAVIFCGQKSVTLIMDIFLRAKHGRGLVF